MKNQPLLEADWIAQLDRLTLSTKQRVRGTRQGRRRSKELGVSLEFADYREYTPGDDVRRFDWSVYGRTGRKVVRQYLDEQELQVTLYVDHSQSMQFGDEHGYSKWLHSAKLAASIGYMTLAAYDRLAIYRVDDEINEGLPLLRGRAAAHRLLSFLEHTEVSGRGSLSEAFQNTAKLPKLPGMTWIFSDCWTESGEAELEEAIARLQAARQEVVLVQVLSREEIQPSLTGDLKLIDAELGTFKEAAITGRLIEAYEKEFAAYRGRLAEFCARRGVAYVLAPIDVPLREIVFGRCRELGLIR
ncbi:DUF58 domain-containing protein [Saccharibacillus sp. JS10]|uniref:DUF58 domain-containing protein n=1 Tax=Saccharibacillus sp. JS10 TaxID=2950552 RepID=UPI002108F6E4|nr:DUF58 domain-containing protein [Saccharibacillus sp. JS10]MCQ4086770.1 DUF58 domain-containing protein [Saccharibacillus sp. JS10]